MSNVPHPVLFLVSAPSGAGKTTLCHRLLEAEPGLKYSISSTTRAPRKGEVDGEDYDFLDREAFRRRIDQGAFLEYAEVHGNFYGTRVDNVLEFYRAGYSVLLDIDVQGAALIRASLRREGVDAGLRHVFVDVFIRPPSLAALRERLEARGKDDPEVIERRLGNAADEMGRASLYQYQVVNDDLESAFGQLRAVYAASRVRTIPPVGC